MPSSAQRKRCIECKRVMAGTRDRPEWCDDCGGEMRPITYGKKRGSRVRRG